MPVIAVVNRKGGSGKSTMATHIAAWFAKSGASVMLGDVDRQQSTRAWLKRRDPTLAPIVPWAMDQKNVLKVPPGVTHVVLDTPGGLHGFEMARVVMSADLILMPVCNSMFDRESAAGCHAELMTLPRVASGRCKLAVVGMRLDSRTRGIETLRDWAKELKVPYLGGLRETQLYVKSLEMGQTIFDLPPSTIASDLEQWAPILEWLQPLAKLPARAPLGTVTRTTAKPVLPAANAARAASLTPNQPKPITTPLTTPAKTSVLAKSRPLATVPVSLAVPEPGFAIAPANGHRDHSAVPQFLLRH